MADTKTVVLKQVWMGKPVGYEITVMKEKADQLIERGIADPKSKPRTRKMTAPKNRMIKTDGKSDTG